MSVSKSLRFISQRGSTVPEAERHALAEFAEVLQVDLAPRKPLVRYEAAAPADKVTKQAPAPPLRFLLALERIASEPTDPEARALFASTMASMATHRCAFAICRGWTLSASPVQVYVGLLGRPRLSARARTRGLPLWRGSAGWLVGGSRYLLAVGILRVDAQCIRTSSARKMLAVDGRRRLTATVPMHQHGAC